MTDRKAKFVAAYVRTGNATQSAKLAGYGAKSAHVTGSRLLRDVEVKAAVDAARVEVVAAINVDTAEAKLDAVTVLTEMLRIGTADLGQAYGKDGAMLAVADMPLSLRRTISSLHYDGETGRLTKVSFWPKVHALDALARHLGLYSEDNEQGVTTFADLVLRAGRRAKAL